MNRCKKCGTELKKYSKFCSVCGQPVQKKLILPRFVKITALIIVGLFGFILICGGITACASGSKPSNIVLERVGTEGTAIFVTLTSPNLDGLSNDTLAQQLRADYQNNNIIQVFVFDNKTAPERWIQLWPSLATMSDADWAKEQAQIFPHWIAIYSRNVNTGLNQVEILSRDGSGKVVRTIKY